MSESLLLVKPAGLGDAEGVCAYMSAFFFSRIDYQDYALRNKTKEMEIVWRGSESLGQETEIFTSVMYGSWSPSIPYFPLPPPLRAHVELTLR
jgi:hypothetical protein